MNRRTKRIIKELREQAPDPEYHPLIRALFKDAADLIEQQATDIDALEQQGSDHG